MSLTVIVLIAGVLVVIALGAIVTGIFNTLVAYRNRYKNAFAQIEVQLKRRYDLIPNLVEAVKGYMTQPRQMQLAQLSAAADQGVYQETLRLARLIEPLDVRVRLPLFEIALPALRALTPAQYLPFKQNVGDLVQADDRIDLFEWSLQRILLRDLETHHGTATPPRVQYHTLASLQPQCEVLLSMLAHAGQRDAEAAQNAFQRAWQQLELPEARLRPADACGLDALDAALAALDEAAPRVKRQILHGAVTCITADRTVTATEAELLRAIAASLGCPMPPLLL